MNQQFTPLAHTTVFFQVVVLNEFLLHLYGEFLNSSVKRLTKLI